MINPDEFTDSVINRATIELRKNMHRIQELTKSNQSEDNIDDLIQKMSEMSEIHATMNVWKRQLDDIFQEIQAHPKFNAETKYSRYNLNFKDFTEMLNNFEAGISYSKSKIGEIGNQLKNLAGQIPSNSGPSVSTNDHEVDKDVRMRELEKFHNLEYVGDNSKYLHKFVSQLELIISNLERMGVDVNHPIMELSIRSKIPPGAINWVYFECDGQRAPDWGVNKFLQTLRQYADIRESEYKNKLRTDPDSLKKDCIFCKRFDHPTHRCPDYPNITTRKARAQELLICPSCLRYVGPRSYHRCIFECDECTEKHHRAVCPKKVAIGNDASGSTA